MGDDFEVVGRIVVDSSGAASIEGMNTSLDAMKEKTGLLSGVTSAFGQTFHYIWSNIMLQAVNSVMSAVGQFFGSIISKGEEAQQIQSQLGAVLKSTGGAAGVSAQQVNDWASALQKSTGVESDAIVSAQSLLLTFTSIKGQTFPQATQAILDMATALNHGAVPSLEDLKSTTMLVGKALQDPDAGLGALHRVGVNVDELKKQFTPLMSVTEKQALILKELGTEFGGSAAAAGQTFAGQMAKVTDNLDNVKEKIFDLITSSPLLAKGFDLINDAIGKVLDFLDALQAGAGVWSFEALGVPPDVVHSIVNLTEKAQAFINNSLTVLGNWWRHNGPFIEDAAKRIFGGLQKLISDLAPSIHDFVQTILTRFSQWFVENGPTISKFAELISFAFTDVIVPAIETLWNTAAPILEGLFNVLLDLITFVMDVFEGNWQDAWTQIKNIALTVWTAVTTAIKNFLEGIAHSMGTSLEEIGNNWKSGWDGLVLTVKTKIQDAIDAVASTLGKWYAIGQNIVQGIMNGIKNQWDSLLNYVSSLMNAVVQTVQNNLNISSPSKKFAWIGEQMMAGMAQGLGQGLNIPLHVLGMSVPHLERAAAGVSGGSTYYGGNTYNSSRRQHFGNVNNIYVSQKPDALHTLKTLRTS